MDGRRAQDTRRTESGLQAGSSAAHGLTYAYAYRPLHVPQWFLSSAPESLSTAEAAAVEWFGERRTWPRWCCQAGFGPERFPGGAPRLAETYANWRVALEGENELRDVHRTMQLWKTVIDDWRPGI